MKNTLLHTTEELIRIQSTANQTKELQRIITYVETYFQGINTLVVKRYDSKEKPSIVISTQDTLSPDVMLVGHLDVVPAPDELFEPRYEGTKLFGRGACDMKSECAVMMELMKEIAVQEDRPNIALMLTTDEEIGGFNGVAFLLNEVGYRCQVALIPDGGQSPDDIVLMNKGILLLRLTAHGKTGHGSRPWVGENAIDRLLVAYEKLRQYIPVKATAEDQWYHTCNIGMIQGGEAANQIPDLATCDIDIRFTEDENVDQLFAKIQEQVGDLAEVELRVGGEPIYTDPTNSFVQQYAECVKETIGTPAVFNKHCGSNDGRFFTSLGIPIIVSRPTSGNQHSPDEWLETESLPVFQEICRQAIKKFHSVC
ncbi:M20/M25/M40 family metallo-hydrolase [Candidatus Uhrbacteria bacterium]|nr:M20/M25/M40 family metallo-hydrolase [Candidatus Uhrbacteria bacterium]